jgi:hypothetical protein
MATNAVLSADAAGGASSEASSNAAALAAQGDQGAALSDEQILGIGTDNDASEGAQPTDALPKPEPAVNDGNAAANQNAAPQATPATQPAPEADFSSLKKFYNDPEAGKLVQSLVDTIQKTREVMPTLAEAYEYRNLYPTLDDAKGAHERALAFEMQQEQLNSGDPKQYGEVFSRYYQENPAAATEFAKSLPEIVRQQAPQVYEQMQSDMIEQGLRLLFQNASGIRDAERREQLTQELADIYQATFEKDIHSPKGAVSPEVLAARREAEQYKQQISERQLADQGRFIQAVDSQLVSSAKSEIDRILAPALDAMNAGAYTRQMVIDRIFQSSMDTLKKTNAYTLQIGREMRNAKGVYDASLQTRLVSAGTQRLAQIVKLAAAKELDALKQDTLKHATEAKNKRTAATSRRDLVNGAPSGNAYRGSKLTPKDVDYKKLSDLDILGL